MIPIIEQVLIDFELRIEEITAEIRIDELPLVQADPVQMRQLFFNLIGNSLKFIKPHQKVIIEVSGDLVNHPSDNGKIGNWYELRVSDNGVGFDEKYLDRIFQPFQRLHNPAIYEGNGMGLAICRKIVERHGGEITAKSAPGQGAIFIVRLPVFNGKGNMQ